MEYNGKFYYKIMWDCGYAGTDGYEIVEFDSEQTEHKLDNISAQYAEENCPAEGWHEEPDIDDLIEAGFADDDGGES